MSRLTKRTRPLVLNEAQFECLRAAPSPGETWIGFTAEEFSERLNSPPAAIPGYWDRHLSRQDLHKLCRDPDVPILSAYVAVMAWGGQGRGHDRTAWAQRETLKKHLELLRSKKNSRADGFRLFQGTGKVVDLGPSYFTKLLHFFAQEPMWIMDLWTSLSVILLFGERIVPVYGEAIGASVGPQHYERFCKAVEEVARRLKCSPENAEMRMFDGANKCAKSWRNHVRAHYGIRTGKPQRTPTTDARTPER